MGSDNEISRRSRSLTRQSRRQKRCRCRSSCSRSGSSSSGRARSTKTKSRNRKHERRHHRRSSRSRNVGHNAMARQPGAQGHVQQQDTPQSPPQEINSSPVQFPDEQVAPNRELPRRQPITEIRQATINQTEPNASDPSFILSINDITQIIQSITHQIQIIHDKNVIPAFDPIQKKIHIEQWIAKVNECASVYNWNDEQTSHYALSKLEGHALRWYEKQPVFLTWAEWQERLKRAFPTETNFGALLYQMLDRRMRLGEPVDEYYYDKMLLINDCGITGKQAVDCLVYGIEDRNIRASASLAACQQPEEFLKYLKRLL